MPQLSDFLGIFTLATLPDEAGNTAKTAYVTDGTGSLMVCDGVIWKAVPTKRVETYTGITDLNGNFTVVFAVPFVAIPHVNPVTYPSADADTRVRNIAVSSTGFTVRSEKNVGLTVLGLTVLGFGTAPVAGVPVRVVVVES